MQLGRAGAVWAATITLIILVELLPPPLHQDLEICHVLKPFLSHLLLVPLFLSPK